jgi:hypothetical protein
MKTLLRLSYVLSVLAVLSYFVDAADGKRTIAVDWILPLSGIVCVFLIPASWIAFARSRRRREDVSIWPHVGLIPFWLHSLAISVMLIGWIAIGGI